jgi:hypothetical protein
MRHFATLAHDAAASDASPSERFERLLAELRAAEDLSAAAQANVASFDYDFMRRLMERNQVTEDLEVRFPLLSCNRGRGMPLLLATVCY